MNKDEFKERLKEIKEQLKELLLNFIYIVNKNLGDLLVIIGLFLINVACYKINEVIGWVISGLIFITLGYLINKKRGDK